MERIDQSLYTSPHELPTQTSQYQHEPTGSSPSPQQVTPPTQQPLEPERASTQYQYAPTVAPQPAQPIAAPVQQQTPADLDPKTHDRVLRLWRLGIRVFAALFVALSIILFVVRGAKWASGSECDRYDDYDDYDNYGYNHYYNPCDGYYDPMYGYDFVSLPIVCIALNPALGRLVFVGYRSD
jgi:hypothetical protein